MNIINKKMYKKTVSLLTLDKNQKLLDIGYGNGYLLKLADKSFSCNLYGIDISEDMKTLAEKRNKKALKANRLNLEVGDCCNLQKGKRIIEFKVFSPDQKPLFYSVFLPVLFVQRKVVLPKPDESCFQQGILDLGLNEN